MKSMPNAQSVPTALLSTLCTFFTERTLFTDCTFVHFSGGGKLLRQSKCCPIVQWTAMAQHLKLQSKKLGHASDW